MNAGDRPEPAMASGVDALIGRLRQDGVEAGRAEAEDIVAKAKAEAARILDKANGDSKQRLETARVEANAYSAAGEQALKTAMRDTVLDMKARLADRFGSDVKRLVSRHLQDETVLRQIILEIAARATEDIGDDEEIEFILPEEAVGLDELRGDPDELQDGTLTKVVLGLTGDMLRAGVSFSASDEMSAGIRIHSVDSEVTVDLTDESIAALLLRHLQPRFRAILEGIVK